MRHAPYLCPERPSGRRLSSVLLFLTVALLLNTQAKPAWAQIVHLRDLRRPAGIPTVQAAAQMQQAHRPIQQVLVKLLPGIDPQAFGQAFSGKFSATPAPAAVGQAPIAAPLPALAYQRSIRHLGWSLYRLPTPEALPTTLDALRKRPEVLYAEPDYHLRMDINPPNDFYWNLEDLDHLIVVLAGLDTTATARDDDSSFWTYTWSLQTVNALDAWNVYPGHYHTAMERLGLLSSDPSRLPLVGVIDSGIDFTHPDWAYPGEPDGNILNGGQIDVALARNLINGNTDPNPQLAKDDVGHGTSVSGIIAAAANQTEGIPGLAFPSRIVPIKIIDANGNGEDSDLLDAITYATDSHCVVINTSLDLDTTSYPQSLQDAVDYAWNNGTLLVSAAGNDGNTSDPLAAATRRYPASLEHVLAVSATTYGLDPNVIGGETIASYSNHGLELGVGAPGGDITTFTNTSPNGADLGLDPIQEYVLVWTLAPTYMVLLSDPSQPDGLYASLGLYGLNYGYLPGTSLACPHVTALAALYCAKNGLTQTPGLPQQLIHAIELGATQMNARSDGGYDTVFGYGRIDASQTLQDTNPRNATVGGFIGQVTIQGTVINNVQVTSQLTNGSGRKYYAVTFPDGIYHMINLPAGTYNVSASALGYKGQTTVTVVPGSDVNGVDLPLTSQTASITVAVAPKTVTLAVGGQQQFTATVKGATDTRVVWSLPVDAGATLSPTGLLTAPTHLLTGSQALVKATSVASPTSYDTAVVTFTPAVTGLTLNPVLVGSAQPSTGTVTLSDPAPTNGAVVALMSDNAVATVPATVTVPAGSTTATFTVTTGVVATSAVAHITATYSNTSAKATLTIAKQPTAAVTLDPAHVPGGWNSIGTATINFPAPTGGLVVPLASDTTAVATVPATVTIPEGATSATFQIHTKVVSSAKTVMISATYNGVQKAPLDVKPPDFNGDGKFDVVFQNTSTQQVTFWFMNGLQVIGSAFAQGSNPIVPLGSQMVGAGDFNGDGYMDLVFQDTVTGQITFWFMNGTTIIATGTTSLNPGPNLRVVGIGDFNGDGKPDFVFQNTSTQQVVIWFMNGTTVLGSGIQPITPAGWQAIGVGDFNGDGKPDIAFQNTTTRQLSVWYMNGSTYSGGGPISLIPAAGWKVGAIADYNGDGKADFVFQNTSTGQVAFWFMNGTKFVNSGFASGPDATYTPSTKVSAPR